jgi:hypothetical protein
MKNMIMTLAVAFACLAFQPAMSGNSAMAFTEGDARLNKWLGINTRRVPWCGAYLSKIVRNPPQHANAVSSWRTWGKRTQCRAGTVAIFRHNHVGKVTAVKPGCIMVKSGNDGNRVRERCRRPATISHCRTT